MLKTRGLKIAHLNITTLYPKIDHLRFLLSNCGLDVLCLNEIRLDCSINDNEVHINGYNLIRKDRNRLGGGVTIYIKDTANFKL